MRSRIAKQPRKRRAKRVLDGIEHGAMLVWSGVTAWSIHKVRALFACNVLTLHHLTSGRLLAVPKSFMLEGIEARQTGYQSRKSGKSQGKARSRSPGSTTLIRPRRTRFVSFF